MGKFDVFLKKIRERDAPKDATYVVMNVSPELPNERILNAGEGLEAIDGGAGFNVVLANKGFPSVPAGDSPSGGLLILPDLLNNSLTTLSASANVLRAVPFWVSRKFRVNNMFFRVSTGASGNARIGLYRDNGSGHPGSLVVQSGEISVSSIGVKNFGFSNTDLYPGQYWTVLISNVAFSVGAAQLQGKWLSQSDMTSLFSHISVSYTYGSLPTTFPTTGITYVAATTAAPLVLIYASIYL